MENRVLLELVQMTRVQIFKSSICIEKFQRHVAGGAVSLFSQQYFSDSLFGIVFIPVVYFISIDERHHIGILL